MTLVELGYPRGKFVDVQADPRGWVLVLQDEATGDLVLLQLGPDGERRVPDVPIPAGGGAAYPVLYVDAAKHTWLAWRHEQIGGILLDLTGSVQRFLGYVYGNAPIGLGAGEVWCQADPAYGYVWRSLDDLDTVRRSPERGAPTGIAWIDVAGFPVLVDAARASVPGLSNPQRAGRCVVGENADAGPNRNIARLTDGRQADLWPGLDSFTPRIATDGGTFAVATWGSKRTRAALLTDVDFRVPEPPKPKPEPLPDQPFVIDPHGVIQDIADWLWSSNQGPDVSFSPDGRIRFFCKSDEGSGDGPGAHIGEHWDLDTLNVGHLDDASAGQRVYQGRAVTAEDIVRLFPNDHARVWASLPLNHNWFDDGARLWMPRRLVSGTVITYRTNIRWSTGYVQPNIPITITVDVGRGRINGKEVRARVIYGPGNDQEINYFGEPHGYNSWIAGPFAKGKDPHIAK